MSLIASLGPALPLLVGPVAAALTEAAKKAPALPFEGQSRAAVVLALSVVSIGAQVGLAALEPGGLAGFDYGAALGLLANAAASVLVGAGGYSLLKK